MNKERLPKQALNYKSRGRNMSAPEQDTLQFNEDKKKIKMDKIYSRNF